MREDQWHRFRPASLHMIEMDIEFADAREKLRVAVQVCFRFAPVELIDPIRGQGPHVVPVGAVAPIARIKAIRPLRIAHAIENTINRGLWIRPEMASD